MDTFIFGLIRSKSVIAFWVCWPSVPNPASANTMVCFDEGGTEDCALEPPPQLESTSERTIMTTDIPKPAATVLLWDRRLCVA